jgi:hypothetical protein
LAVYRGLSDALMWGMVHLALYRTVADAVTLARLERLPLTVDVFDVDALRPIARSSLGTALMLLGGITVTAPILGPRILMAPGNLHTYGLVTAAAALSFFATTWSTHRLIDGAKQREGAVSGARVRDALARLKAGADAGSAEEVRKLADTVALWTAYEQRVLAVPTWPYSSAMLRWLGFSVLFPITLGITQGTLARQLWSAFGL